MVGVIKNQGLGFQHRKGLRRIEINGKKNKGKIVRQIKKMRAYRLHKSAALSQECCTSKNL